MNDISDANPLIAKSLNAMPNLRNIGHDIFTIHQNWRFIEVTQSRVQRRAIFRVIDWLASE
jgi:hypothetical protein